MPPPWWSACNPLSRLRSSARLSLTGVRTALNVDKGLALIRKVIDDQGGGLAGRER